MRYCRIFVIYRGGDKKGSMDDSGAWVKLSRAGIDQGSHGRLG